MAKNTNKKNKRNRQEISKIRVQSLNGKKKSVSNPTVDLFNFLQKSCNEKYYGYNHKFEEVSHLSNGISNAKLGFYERRALKRLIEVARKLKLITYRGKDNKSVLNAFVNLANDYYLWINDPEDFVALKTSIIDSVYDLVRFLVINYEVPYCLNKVWLMDNSYRTDKKEKKLLMSWFYNVGLGKNIRKQKGLYVHLTKKQAHFLYSVPKKLSIKESFRYAQLMGLGFRADVIKGIMDTPLGKNFEDEEFWITVMHFFANNSFLSVSKYIDIYDFISATKYGKFRRGERVEPENPNFSIKGRTVESVLQLTEEWSNRIARERNWMIPGIPERWKSSSIKPYENDGINIVELSSHMDLIEEGRRMHHCVRTYARDCAAGVISIFSMRNDDKSLVTIEVCLESCRVVQAKSYCNYEPNEDQIKLIFEWAKLNKLEVSSTIGRE